MNNLKVVASLIAALCCASNAYSEDNYLEGVRYDSLEAVTTTFLSVHMDTDEYEEVNTYAFSNLLVNGVSISADDDEEPLENLTLSFSKCEILYRDNYASIDCNMLDRYSEAKNVTLIFVRTGTDKVEELMSYPINNLPADDGDEEPLENITLSFSKCECEIEIGYIECHLTSYPSL